MRAQGMKARRVRGVEQWCHNVEDSLLPGYLGIIHFFFSNMQERFVLLY
jgi:hypothetical protein